MDKLIFISICVMVAVVPLSVTTLLLNGIELPKLLTFFGFVGVIVSLRLLKNG